MRFGLELASSVQHQLRPYVLTLLGWPIRPTSANHEGQAGVGLIAGAARNARLLPTPGQGRPGPRWPAQFPGERSGSSGLKVFGVEIRILEEKKDGKNLKSEERKVAVVEFEAGARKFSPTSNST